MNKLLLDLVVIPELTFKNIFYFIKRIVLTKILLSYKIRVGDNNGD